MTQPPKSEDRPRKNELVMVLGFMVLGAVVALVSLGALFQRFLDVAKTFNI
jgi:hypothetical protein